MTSVEDATFDARYVPFLRAAEDRHFWFRTRNTVIASVMRRIEPTLSSGYRVLEIGCGTGNTLRVLSTECRRGRVFGIDVYYDGLVHARDRVGPRVLQADVSQVPFSPSTRFDVIGMFDVLEHIDDDSGTLQCVHRLLTNGGILLTTVPASMSLWSAFDLAAHHRRRYECADLREKLSAAGFTVEYLSPFMATLYPLAWVKRRASLVWRRERDVFEAALDDLRVVPFLNGALERILSREARVVGALRSLPFGTSLIAIARRTR